MDKGFLKPDKEKIVISATIILISIILIIGLLFAGFDFPILSLFFIFYLPVFFVLEMVYTIIPLMRPDMDTMTTSQFNFHFGLMFGLSFAYVYLVSCAIVFVRRKSKKDNDS